MNEPPAADAASRAPTRGFEFAGALCVAAGAALFASKGIFAKRLYAEGIAFETLVAVRAAFSWPLFLAFALWREGPQALRATSRRAVLAAAGAGFLCYYVGAVLDFRALTMIDASIERVLMFSYPAMIVLFAAILTGRAPSRGTVAALVATYAGIFLAVGGLDRGEMRANALGSALVIASALTFAIYYLVLERVAPQIGSARFTLFGMGAATAALVAHFLVFPGAGALRELGPSAWLTLAVLGVGVMFVPALLQAEGVRRIGAQRAGLVSTVGPPTTILLGWAVLGERMTPWQLAGAALIVGGVVVLERARAAARSA